MRTLIALSVTLLVGCGGGNDNAAAPEAPAANNPLAEEQALIQQAEDVQALLDKNSEDKQKNLPE